MRFTPYLFLVFWGSLFDYNVHALIKSKFHSKNDFQFPPIKLSLIILSLAGVLFEISRIPTHLLPNILLVGSITILYSLPFYLPNQTTKQIKKIPFLKTIMIAFVWSYLTVLIPLDNLGISLGWMEKMGLFIGRFFFIAAISIPFDLRDQETDEIDGVKTIAHLLGTQKSYVFFYGLILLSLGSQLIYLFQTHQTQMAWPFLASYFISVMVCKSESLKKKSFYYPVLLDGLLVLQFILVYGYFRIFA